MKHIYGPVQSRRLGVSLGVDLVPYKICSFDCIYCQLGRTTNKTIVRREYVAINHILSELRGFLGGDIDYITLSGSGEPTLNSKIGDIIKEIKRMSSIPVAVLTNGSLLFDKGVREELRYADLILPSLDAATAGTFEQVNRPHSSLSIEKVIDGLKAFRKVFDGDIWVEIMLVQGINDSLDEIELLVNTIEDIDMEKVQLNTVVRPPCEEDVQPLHEAKMKQICRAFGERAEIIYDRKRKRAYKEKKEYGILELLKRRPCTIEDISNALGMHRNEVIKYIDVLKNEQKVDEKIPGGEKYFQTHL
jgi:wyosine [tRNA(Phe)-imidazoG37] synthetase (radical SAM superfamily)